MYRSSLFDVDGSADGSIAATPAENGGSCKRPNDPPGHPPRTQAQLQQASILLRDAQEGRPSFFYDTLWHLWWYQLYHTVWTQVVLYLCITLDLSLALFEEPNGNLGLLWPVAASASIEVVCLLVFTARVVHMRVITPPVLFWRDRKNVVLIFCIGVRPADMLDCTTPIPPLSV